MNNRRQMPEEDRDYWDAVLLLPHLYHLNIVNILIVPTFRSTTKFERRGHNSCGKIDKYREKL